MYQDLKEKVAVVTGVGSERGMGFAIAQRLAAEGCRLLVSDICPLETIEALAARIVEAGVEALAYRCDISDEEEVDKMARAAVGHYGRVDILVNNAGVLRAKAFLEHSPEDWDLMFSVMVKGSYLCTRAFAKGMVAQGSGVVINISSMGGKRVFSGEAAYGTCKRAIVHLTQAAAVELSPLGVRVNGIAPGDHWTEMLEKCFVEMAAMEGCTVEDLIAESEAETPLRRLGTTEDIAKVVAFLASDQAGFITGQVINVNGGLHME